MQSYGSITITDLTDKSVKSVYAFYKSTSSAQAPAAPTAPQEGAAPSGWSTQVTTSSSNPYAWMIIITYYTEGDAYVSQPSQVGNHASSVTNVTNEIRYASGDSSTNPPQSGWQVDPATTSTTNPYLWTRITPIVTIDSTSSRLAPSYMVSVPIEGISENAVKSTMQLWRTSSTKPVVPTGHQTSRITISTTDYSSGWNPMSPVDSSSGTVENFSNLWYITETQYLDGTYEYTQPQRDANYHIVNAIGVFKNDLASNSGTTVIDGGHITTNSIKADQIDVNDLSAEITTIGDPTKEHFTITGTTLKAYDTDNNQYFSVSANGLTYGNNAAVSQSNLTDNYYTKTQSDTNFAPKSTFYFDINGAHILSDTYRTDVKDGLEVVRILNETETVLADINPNGVTFNSGDGIEIAHLGYGPTQGESESTNAPYYDLGIRKSGTTKGSHSVVEGIRTTASAITSHAEGYETVASGYYSHAEGASTNAIGNGSHAEGDNTNAIGSRSHAEGDTTHAIGDRSHAEGLNTTANGSESHAEGLNTTADGVGSHAEGGYLTTASGDYSHAEGRGTEASGDNSHAQGKYNVANSLHADTVGNGTDTNNRSNAYALDWNGNGYFAGDVYVGCNTDSSGGQKVLAGDSGWKNLTITGDFTAYNDEVVPQYRKVGTMVNVVGAIKPTVTGTGSTTKLAFAQLPVGYRPVQQVNVVCHGSSRSLWLLQIESDGTLYFSRYADGNAYTSYTPTHWMPFNATFMIA